jgi:hypothetical protein
MQNSYNGEDLVICCFVIFTRVMLFCRLLYNCHTTGMSYQLKLFIGSLFKKKKKKN